MLLIFKNFVCGCSNSSDALDKLRFLSVTDPSLMESDSNLEIRIKTDPDAGTLTIIYAPNFVQTCSLFSLMFLILSYFLGVTFYTVKAHLCQHFAELLQSKRRFISTGIQVLEWHERSWLKVWELLPIVGQPNFLKHWRSDILAKYLQWCSLWSEYEKCIAMVPLFKSTKFYYLVCSDAWKVTPT